MRYLQPSSTSANWLMLCMTRMPPLFPSSIWNVYQTNIADKERTTFVRSTLCCGRCFMLCCRTTLWWWWFCCKTHVVNCRRKEWRVLQNSNAVRRTYIQTMEPANHDNWIGNDCKVRLATSIMLLSLPPKYNVHACAKCEEHPSSSLITILQFVQS